MLILFVLLLLLLLTGLLILILLTGLILILLFLLQITFHAFVVANGSQTRQRAAPTMVDAISIACALPHCGQCLRTMIQ